MKTMMAGLLMAAGLLTAQRPLAAVTEQLTDRDIANAINIANSGDTTRALFHAPYLLPLKDATVEQLEVVTEFRRFVLAAEQEIHGGNWMLGRGGLDQKGRSLKDILRPFAGQVAIRARLRFHPQNLYVTVPAFDIMLGEPTLLAVRSTTTPLVTPASGEPGSRDVIVGATIETSFNALSIEDRVLPVRLFSEGKELARTMADFSRLE